MSVNSTNSANAQQAFATFETETGLIHHPLSQVALHALDESILGKELAKVAIKWVKGSKAFLRSFFSEQGRAQYAIISELKPSIERFFKRNGIELTAEISGQIENLTDSLQESLEKEFAKPVKERCIEHLSEGDQLLIAMVIQGLPKGTIDKMSAFLESELNFIVTAAPGTPCKKIYNTLGENLEDFKMSLGKARINDQ